MRLNLPDSPIRMDEGLEYVTSCYNQWYMQAMALNTILHAIFNYKPSDYVYAHFLRTVFNIETRTVLDSNNSVRTNINDTVNKAHKKILRTYINEALIQWLNCCHRHIEQRIRKLKPTAFSQEVLSSILTYLNDSHSVVKDSLIDHLWYLYIVGNRPLTEDRDIVDTYDTVDIDNINITQNKPTFSKALIFDFISDIFNQLNQYLVQQSMEEPIALNPHLSKCIDVVSFFIHPWYSDNQYKTTTQFDQTKFTFLNNTPDLLRELNKNIRWVSRLSSLIEPQQLLLIHPSNVISYLNALQFVLPSISHHTTSEWSVLDPLWTDSKLVLSSIMNILPSSSGDNS